MRYFALLFIVVSSCSFAQTFRSYHIGNSLTGQTLSHVGFGLGDLNVARGINATWGHHLRCGSQLNQTYIHPTETCVTPVSPYSYFGNALPNYTWDAVTLQPYGDPMPEGRSAANSLIDLALQQSSNSTAYFYIMSMWPQGESTDSYATRWTRNYDEVVDTYESRWSRQYYLNFTQHLREDNPNLKIGTVLSGEVVYQFEQLAQQGQISGFTSATQLYGDPYHLSTNGSYLSRMTLFATMYHTSPVGLPVPANVTFTTEDVLELQNLVWDVVTSNAQYSLVLSADGNRDLRVNTLDFNLLSANFGTYTYLNSQGDFNGDGQVNSFDFNVLLSQYGTNVENFVGTTVPEPVCFVSLAMLLFGRRKVFSR